MALVPVTLSGTFDLTSLPDTPTNFDIFVSYQGGCPVSTGFNAVAGLSTIQTFLESVFTGILGGTVTSSSVTYSAPNLTINIVGTGQNDATYGVGSVFTTSALSGSSNCLAFYFGQDCPDCPDCPPSVNPDDATDCLSCYQLEADFCATPITIQGLDISTAYTLSITDNVSGKKYSYSVTTDTNGEADIDTADFPTALFSPYNSPFTITIADSNGDPVVLTYGYVNYSCIELTIVNADTI